MKPLWQAGRLGVLSLLIVATGWAYDPLVVTDTDAVTVHDFSILDRLRQREIPLRVFLPPGRGPVPVVLFSHGLGGSRMGNEFLGRHWAARGFVVIFVQHPGSDDSVWRARPRTERLPAMQQAASSSRSVTGRTGMNASRLPLRSVPAVRASAVRAARLVR